MIARRISEKEDIKELILIPAQALATGQQPSWPEMRGESELEEGEREGVSQIGPKISENTFSKYAH